MHAVRTAAYCPKSRPLTKAHCVMPFATNAALSWHWNPTVSTTSCGWGIAKEVLQAAGKNYQDKNALLPLPQEEIDKSNGVLKQNPDY